MDANKLMVSVNLGVAKGDAKTGSFVSYSTVKYYTHYTFRWWNVISDVH